MSARRRSHPADGAERFAELLRPLGMPVDVVGAGPGDAAGLKLVRSVLDRLLTGSRRHALRRGEEMRAAAEYLDALGVPPHVGRAASAWFHDLLDSA